MYVTGYSVATWSGPGATAPLNAGGGAGDIVVLKLNTNGAYQWHTFYGSGTQPDRGQGVAVDIGGNVYVTGFSYATWNGPASQTPLNSFSETFVFSEIVVLKLNAGGAYQWHTFYGAAGSADVGSGIAVDASSNVYVTGYSTATWNAPGPTTPLNAHSGVTDIVVLKLNTNGAYQWHTFYGAVTGISADYGTGIAVDGSGNVYVTGSSTDSWNGPGATAPLNAHSGVNEDIVVLKLNTNGAYQWHAFYGSITGVDLGLAIAVDGGGNPYVTGYSTGTWDGPGATAPRNAHSGGGFYDMTVFKLSTAGAYQWHTFFGSAGVYDAGTGIAVDSLGNQYVTGYSPVTWNGPGAAVPLNAYSGSYDIVVLKLAPASTPPIAVADSTNTLVGAAGTFDVSSNDTKPVGATYALVAGSTCAGSSVSVAGLAGFTAPITVGANCTVNYRVCNPAPDGCNLRECDADCHRDCRCPANSHRRQYEYGGGRGGDF